VSSVLKIYPLFFVNLRNVFKSSSSFFGSTGLEKIELIIFHAYNSNIFLRVYYVKTIQIIISMTSVVFSCEKLGLSYEYDKKVNKMSQMSKVIRMSKMNNMSKMSKMNKMSKISKMNKMS